MQLWGMDKELIDIYNIRNLEYVKVWDLQINSSDKILVIPAIMIIYDDGKTLNLCSRDKYFYEYVKKVVEVYNDEKNNILENSLTDPFFLHRTIEIDEKSKDILNSGSLENIEDIYSFYQDKDSYEESFIYQLDEVKMLQPIINYHIKKLFSFTDKTIVLEDDISGYHDNYVLNAKIDGIDVILPLTYVNIDDNHYTVEIGNLTDKSMSSLSMNIFFKNNEINVETNISRYNLFSQARYFITDNLVKEIYSVKEGIIPLCYENRDLECSDNLYSGITNFDCPENLKYFKLPWDAIYGIDTSKLDISEVEKTISIHNMYLSVLDDTFLKKEYYSKKYFKDRTVSMNSEEVVLCEVIKNTRGVLLDKDSNIYLVETNFKGSSQNGYYDNHLSDKYFYHLIKSDDIKDIKRENMISISKNDVSRKEETLNKSKMLKLVRGK